MRQVVDYGSLEFLSRGPVEGVGAPKLGTKQTCDRQAVDPTGRADRLSADWLLVRQPVRQGLGNQNFPHSENRT